VTSLTVDEQSVGGASGERSGAIGSVQGDGAVFVRLKRPPSLVNQVVMLGAERDEIVEIGAAAALPRDDVVNLASAESGLAVRPTCSTSPEERSTTGRTSASQQSR